MVHCGVQGATTLGSLEGEDGGTQHHTVGGASGSGSNTGNAPGGASYTPEELATQAAEKEILKEKLRQYYSTPPLAV